MASDVRTYDLLRQLKGVIVSSVWSTFTWFPVIFPVELGLELEPEEMQSYERIETHCSVPQHMQENSHISQLEVGLYHR